MILAPLVLTGAVLSYGVSTLMLAHGSTGGFVAALRDRSWLGGNVVQGLGFVLAFLARRDLPLVLVQPAITASLVVACVLGAALGRWRLGRRDVAGLTVVVVGVGALAASAVPGRASVPDPAVILALSATLVPCAAAAVVGLRRNAPTGAWALATGLLAGVAFGISAIGARVLAGDPLSAVHSLIGFVSLVMLGAGLVLGQVLLTTALSGRAVAGPTAMMHTVETIGPALLGVLLLGDAVAPGRGWVAVLGCVAAVLGSLLLVDHGTPGLARDAVVDDAVPTR